MPSSPQEEVGVNTVNENDSRLNWIRDRLRAAETRARRLRRTHAASLYASLVTSTLATGLAGYAATAGSPLSSWRLTCGVVAGLTFIAAIASGAQKQLDLNARLAKATTCTGRLRALEFAVAVTGKRGEEIDTECQTIAKEYPDLVGS
jgi:hypothetical protein